MKPITKVIGMIVTAILLIFAMSACAPDAQPTATQKDQNTSAQILAKMEQAQPAPEFDWSQIRQTLIDSETAQAQTTQTTSFFMEQGVRDPIFVCPSIGFPVPGTDQITNPNQVDRDYSQYGGGNTVISQIDPNGIYSGDTSASLVICVNGKGKPEVHHAEEHVHAVAGPATWDYVNHRIQLTGDPTFAPKIGK